MNKVTDEQFAATIKEAVEASRRQTERVNQACDAVVRSLKRYLAARRYRQECLGQEK
jgi:hypothetical protein